MKLKANRRASKDALAAIDRAARRIIAIAPKDSPVDFLLYLEHHAPRLALDFEWTVNNVDRSETILEIGAFPFFLTATLTDAGYSVKTLDMGTEETRALAAIAGIQMNSCDIEQEKFPVPDNYFDEVIFNEVFEHLRVDLLFTFEEIIRVLKPGGRLWLSTPNLASLRGITNLVLRREAWSCVGGGVYSQWSHLRTAGWMGHVREYTAPEVSQFLRNLGFKQQTVVYRGQFKNPVAHVAASVFRGLSPFFSVVAYKPIAEEPSR